MACTRHESMRHIARSALVLAFVLPASSAAQLPQGGASDPLAELRALIADAACTKDGQCRTIAIGASACGGPERYLAWSTARTDEAALRKAAAAYPGDRLAAVRRGGAFSTCRFLTDPGAQCTKAAGAADNGSCTLRRAGPNAAPAPDR